MTGKRIGYIRVSTVDQNPDRQLCDMQLDKKFIDYASGSTINRPSLQALIEYVRDDDIVFVHSLDRLGRNTMDLLKIVESFIKKRVTIVFVKENLTFSGQENPMSQLIFVIMSAIAQFERSLIRERQMEGVRLAKLQGRYAGRLSKLTNPMREDIMERMQTRETKGSICRNLKISRASLNKYLSIIKQEAEKNQPLEQKSA